MKRKQSKAKINWGWDAPENRNGKATRTTRKQQKELNKTVKSLGFRFFLTVFIVVLVFCAIGFGGTYFLTRKDCFVLLGDKDIVIDINSYENISDCCYIEDGYKVIEFNKDVSHKIEIETNMLINNQGNYTPVFDELGNPVIGQYYIIYRAKTFKYSKFSTIELIRFITFDESSDVVEQ